MINLKSVVLISRGGDETKNKNSIIAGKKNDAMVRFIRNPFGLNLTDRKVFSLMPPQFLLQRLLICRLAVYRTELRGLYNSLHLLCSLYFSQYRSFPLQ